MGRVCRACEAWKPISQEWGWCTEPRMAFDFVPYTQGPFDMDLAAWNELQRPFPQPMTMRGYSCENFRGKD